MSYKGVVAERWGASGERWGARGEAEVFDQDIPDKEIHFFSNKNKFDLGFPCMENLDFGENDVFHQIICDLLFDQDTVILVGGHKINKI